MRSEHELLEDAVAAYLLGASEPGEAETVRAHLAGCASCRQLAARLTRAVGALPLAVDEVAPPGRLRERILAAASAEPPVRNPDFSRNLAVRPRRMPDFGRNLALGRARWVPLAAAAAVLLAVGVAGGVGISRATAPGVAAAHYTLRGVGSLQGAAAAVVDFRGTATTLVEFRGLPAAPEGKVYELWLIPGAAKPIAAGVFVPDADGSKVLVLPRDLTGVAVMAVTVEQGPEGAAQPTQQPELSGALT
jgi:anti-sigma-K factor RskA